MPLRAPQSPLQFRWADTISSKEWSNYRAAIRALLEAKIPFMLGGGFALAAFTGRWRDTKDIDLYILPQDRQAAVAVLTRAGFADYYPRLPYDRKWIYRSTHSDVIVDIIWSMANQRAQVDADWFSRAGKVALRNQSVLVVPLECFLWCKLYILQRDHCDWTDLFNLLYACGPNLDWEYLLGLLGEDFPLLRALLIVYGWLCPSEVLKLPAFLWDRLGTPPPPQRPPPAKRNRVRLLDSRAWFAGQLPENQKLQV